MLKAIFSLVLVVAAARANPIFAGPHVGRPWSPGPPSHAPPTYKPRSKYLLVALDPSPGPAPPVSYVPLVGDRLVPWNRNAPGEDEAIGSPDEPLQVPTTLDLRTKAVRQGSKCCPR